VLHIVQSFQRRFVSELQEIVSFRQPEEEHSAGRSKSSDFRKFPNLKDKKKLKNKLPKTSPYKKKWTASRPKSSLEVRMDSGSNVRRNKARIYSVDFQQRSRTPVENY
jgi:hypothetical protein